MAKLGPPWTAETEGMTWRIFKTNAEIHSNAEKLTF